MKILILKKIFVLTFFSFAIFIAHIKCKTKTQKKVNNQRHAIDSVGTIYAFDTLRFIKHKSGFYLSINKDIFQLNSVGYPDSTGFWSTHYWLDSLMFFGAYPKRQSLKYIIDL